MYLDKASLFILTCYRLFVDVALLRWKTHFRRVIGLQVLYLLDQLIILMLLLKILLNDGSPLHPIIAITSLLLILKHVARVLHFQLVLLWWLYHSGCFFIFLSILMLRIIRMQINFLRGLGIARVRDRALRRTLVIAAAVVF